MAFTSMSTALTLAITFTCFQLVDSNHFLGQVPSADAEGEMNLHVEAALLTEMEKEMGGEHRSFTEKRLDRIKHSLVPIYNAMVKNSQGKLDLAAASYTLRRLLLERHAWFVKGLEPESRSFAAWSASKPTLIFGSQVSTNVSGLFEDRIANGMDLHEIAIMAATLEHLVHKEALTRLNAAYQSLGYMTDSVIGKDEVSKILDSYMSIYILGILSGDVNSLSPQRVRELRGNVTELYPTFPDTQQFLRDVEAKVLPKRDFVYFSEVMNVVEEVGDRYGRWQNSECLTLKGQLMAIEDRGVGGAGRVRLADFYRANLEQGRWEFSETSDFMRQLGALDESDPENPKVIIPNYINGPTNCVASTAFYAVCCIDECDGLLGHLESQVGRPTALPTDIARIISGLPSSSVPANRTLSQWLLHRLDEVAAHHGGRVPLHGRLFAQFMHYAYPRECSYPHVLGATRLQRGDEYAMEHEKSFAVSTEEMQAIVAAQKNHTKPDISTVSHEDMLRIESGMWTLEEELICMPPPEEFAPQESSIFRSLRALMMFVVLASVSVVLTKTLRTAKSIACIGQNEKYYV